MPVQLLEPWLFHGDGVERWGGANLTLTLTPLRGETHKERATAFAEAGKTAEVGCDTDLEFVETSSLGWCASGILESGGDACCGGACYTTHECGVPAAVSFVLV